MRLSHCQDQMHLLPFDIIASLRMNSPPSFQHCCVSMNEHNSFLFALSHWQEWIHLHPIDFVVLPRMNWPPSFWRCRVAIFRAENYEENQNCVRRVLRLLSEFGHWSPWAKTTRAHLQPDHGKKKPPIIMCTLLFLSRATRPISHYVGLSVCRSVCQSVGPTFFLAFLSILKVDKHVFKC